VLDRAVVDSDTVDEIDSEAGRVLDGGRSTYMLRACGSEASEMSLSEYLFEICWGIGCIGGSGGIGKLRTGPNVTCRK
jgi:hypothetical protein